MVKWAQNIVHKDLTFIHRADGVHGHDGADSIGMGGGDGIDADSTPSHGNEHQFECTNPYGHDYDIWQKSLGMHCSKTSKSTKSTKSSASNVDHKTTKKRKKKRNSKRSKHSGKQSRKFRKHQSAPIMPPSLSLSDEDIDGLNGNTVGIELLDPDDPESDHHLDAPIGPQNEVDFTDLDDSDEDDGGFDDDHDSDRHRIAMNDAFTDHTDHKEEEKERAVTVSADELDHHRMSPQEQRLFKVLRPILPHLRYALMAKEFFIDNVARFLSPKQRDAVYVHYILPDRPTKMFNDSERIEYSNKRFEVVASNVRLDKAQTLSSVDDWWSHTNFATESPQWFVVKLPDPSYVVNVHWKNRWGDGETAKDIDLQVSRNPNRFSEANEGWHTFWSFRSEKTSNWLTFEVPQNEEIKPSMYWRFVVKTLYGDNSCRCGLDQIKITCSL